MYSIMSGVYYQGFNINLEKLLMYVKSRISDGPILAKIELMLNGIRMNVQFPLKRFHAIVYKKYRNKIVEGDDSYFLLEKYDIESDIVSILKETYVSMNNTDKEYVKKKLQDLVNCVDKLIAYEPNFSSTN